MIIIEDKSKCCGCSACAAACPHNCITITSDKEGFYYPHVDASKCVNCGLCDSICPVINNKEEKPHQQNSYVIQNRDKEVLKESTSGGAFTAFAKSIIEKNGIVVGAALNEDLVAEHIIVEKVEDLKRFRNSKYVQSYISLDVLRKIKKRLKEGVYVCFSGTSCQIEGLLSYLGKVDISTLLCIDVVCRAVPSPFIYKKYLEYQTDKNKSDIKGIRFRDKYFGYRFPSINITFADDKKAYHRGIESDPWLRAFFTGICNRPSCYNCSFKKRYRVSDITIWDCFDYENRFPLMIPNMGATNVLIHTNKGNDYFERVKDSFIVEPVDTELQLSKIKEMTRSTECHSQRSQFFADALNLDGKELFSKYYPVGFKQDMLYFGRLIALKIGVYKLVKSMLKR